MMEILIIANIIAIVINIVFLIHILLQLKKLIHNFKTEYNALDEKFEKKISELSNAVKFLTRLNIKNMKGIEEKSKIVPFKPEDIDKIKEQLNVSSTGT
jgi:hypothetical protein